MTAKPSAKPMPKVVSFQDPLPQPRLYRPQADRILAGDPAQAAINLFRSADGRFNSGIWEAQPGKWRVVFTESEFCHPGGCDRGHRRRRVAAQFQGRRRFRVTRRLYRNLGNRRACKKALRLL